MAKKQTANHQSNVMYQQVVGTCTIKMMLDKRNSSRYADGIFPLAIRFTINDERYYHKLGDSFSEKNLLPSKPPQDKERSIMMMQRHVTRSRHGFLQLLISMWILYSNSMRQGHCLLSA